MLIRNPFTTFTDLPDKPRFGVKLMLAGIGVGILRWSWPRVAPPSFQQISAAFMRWEPYLPHHGRLPGIPWKMSDFGDLLMVTAFLVFLCGAFIFLRRGFWWVAENRPEKEITELFR